MGKTVEHHKAVKNPTIYSANQKWGFSLAGEIIKRGLDERHVTTAVHVDVMFRKLYVD